jgi:hypothetical protein
MDILYLEPTMSPRANACTFGHLPKTDSVIDPHT